mgnify:CR=1 FL=1
MKTRMILTIPVPVPNDAFIALCDYMDEVKCKRDIAELTGAAISTWIADARKRAAQSADQLPKGYQWKTVFLPTGTRLKTIVQGRAFYATVDGDQINYEGRPVSPHEFANLFGVDGRNAWRDVWVHLPYEPIWQGASLLRKKIQC